MKLQEEDRKEKNKTKKKNEKKQDQEDGFSEHSPVQGAGLPSSASSLPKSADRKEEYSQVELELRLLEALEIYPPSKLQGIHRHFVLYGLMDNLKRRFGRNFSADEVLQLLDRFFNLKMMKSEDEDLEAFNQEDGFSLPRSFFIKEEQ